MSLTPRRIVKRDASDLGDVADLLSDSAAPVVLVVDVDNTLVRQGAPADEFAAVVNAAIDCFEEHQAVARVIALTNGAQRGVPRLVSRGNKPWTTRRRLGLRGDVVVVVVGDQIMTDGILAWRLGATFIHLVIDDSAEPPDQARLRSRGEWFAPLLFKEGPVEKA
ncbi:MAG: hypothetical protein GY788_15690 [bacterium]|nr:hypothetical protein [bacterium]